MDSAARPVRRKRWLLKVLASAGGLAIVAALAGIWLFRSLRQTPEFYVRALELSPAAQTQAGDAFERHALELTNDVRREDHWQARFTADEINGWLAVDLPEKFPRALPPHVLDPRVALEPGVLQFACRYDDGRVATVVSAAVSLDRTDDPDVLAVRIRHVRAGSLPLPLGQFLDQISAAAAQAGVPVRWTEAEGDPVALVTIPWDHGGQRDRRVRIDGLEIRAGEVVVSGSRAAPPPNVARQPDAAAPPAAASDNRQR